MKPFLLGQVCLFSRGLLLVVSGNVSRFLQSNKDPAVQKIHNPKKVGPYQVIDEVISYNPLINGRKYMRNTVVITSLRSIGGAIITWLVVLNFIPTWGNDPI